jgi:Mechanosensitive ion channel
VRTQLSLLRRLVVVMIAVLAGAAMLLTFPAARAAGASILASAGVISIVAGLAAQTSLANVFAGLQLAFTDAIRVDDVVVVQEEWGRIEEITLTYVVVHVWDDRRLVLPSTYFTTTPFQNWTRKESAVLGAVELDVDWSTPFDGMRAELDRLLGASPLWDRRVGVLQVTDAVGALVRVRVLVSAHDGPTLFDLRCQVREGLVVWLRREHEHALPRFRHEPAGAGPAAAGRRPPSPTVEGLFTGSSEGRQRSRAFTGPDDAELADRDTEVVAAR